MSHEFSRDEPSPTTAVAPAAAVAEVSRRHVVAASAALAAVAGTGSAALAQTSAGGLRFHNPEGRAASPGFTQGVEAIGPARIIYVSGQQGLDAGNKVVGDFPAQATQAFENIKAILASAGAGFEHVVKLNHYFIDLKAHQPLLRDIRARYFTGRPQPASTTVQVMALVREGALYEVEAVAVVPMG
jgi:enamine deaminase RidA (YjgF/YER057c/UK114 family)